VFDNNLVRKNTHSLGLNSQILANKPIIELDEIDSTNNYAMRLIDADSAQDGMTITAASQSNGKGQRGKQWTAAPYQSILMSIIIRPPFVLSEQFTLSALVAVAVADAVQQFCETSEVKIKWTNDIMLGDKKAGGILIENIIRGSQWSYAVIGIGLNVLQSHRNPDLPHATSLKMASGNDIEMMALRDVIRLQIFSLLEQSIDPVFLLQRYNEYLYKRNQLQLFNNDEKEWTAIVKSVTKEGKLVAAFPDGSIAYYTHGFQNWVY